MSFFKLFLMIGFIKKIRLSFFFCLAFFAFYPVASNAEFHVNLTVTNNYVGRAYSKSDDNFAIQANIDYEHSSGLYLGTSVSNVDFGDDNFDDSAEVEVTPYLGWTFSLGEDWRLDTQWTRYLYDGKIFGHQSDYNEFYLFLHFRDLITARASFSENYYDQGNATSDYELTGRYPLTDYLEFSASGGYSLIKSVLEYDYAYWNAGLTFFYQYVALDLRYYDAFQTSTNDVEVINPWPFDPETIKPSFVFSLSIGF